MDYLHGSRLQNLNVTWQFVEKMKRAMPAGRRPAPAAAAAEQAPKGDSAVADDADAASKKAKSKTAAPASDFDPAKARFLREINYNEMQRSVMRAYFQVQHLRACHEQFMCPFATVSHLQQMTHTQLFSALERDGLVQNVAPTYSSTRIRFAHRFAAFKSISFPATLSHDDYTKNSDFSPYKVELIYKSADECFKVARAHGEELLHSDAITGSDSMHESSSASGKQRVVHGAEVEALMKVAIANSVALMRREQASASRTKKPAHKSSNASAPSGKATPELFDFSVHPHFPIVAFPDKRA